MSKEQLVFGLDIGTRSVVGSVGYMDNHKFHVVAHHVREHETRAMVDGQIHDIQKVGETIGYVKRELERQLGGEKLTRVCIAAAGRQLNTVTVHVEQERTEDTAVTADEIYALDSLGIEKAYDIIREQKSDLQFYCVGYSVVKYEMNHYNVNNLEGHKAKEIGADVLATFLPYEVVDGLYASVAAANLEVDSLTLEPIAAMNVAIPQQFRLLNIALVDVGAGTSDICITKDESIVAYGMIPHAGDEITETLVHQYLVDFQTAEEIKKASLGTDEISYTDIMGLEMTVSAETVRSVYEPVVADMAKEIAEKITELNGGKPVSAVFVVGGGGKVPGFTEKLAENLGIVAQRVALRGKEVLGDIEFEMPGVEKDPLLVTPIGICMNYYHQKNNFIFVNINDIRIKLYDNDHLTVVDAAAQTGFPNEDLFAKRGKSLNYTLNGVKKMIRGQSGEPAKITINGEPADFHAKISSNDRIYIQESTCGEDASCRVEQLREYRESLHFVVNGAEVTCPKFVRVGNEQVLGSYEIKEGDEIYIQQYYTVAALMEFMDISMTENRVMVNGHEAASEEALYENFEIRIEEADRTEADDWEEAVKEEEETLAEEEISQEMQNTEEQKQEAPNVNETALPIRVNQTMVTLRGKEKYTFVDILDFYPFDTATMGGKNLVTRINGVPCNFTDALAEDDWAELFWED